MLNWLEKNWRISASITILIAIFIFIMSSFVFDISPGIYQMNYKSYIYHFTIFFLLSGFLLITTLKGKNKLSIILLVFTISILYGILDEFHQYFVPGRFCCLEDMIVNSTGISLSTGLYYIRNKIKNK